MSTQASRPSSAAYHLGPAKRERLVDATDDHLRIVRRNLERLILHEREAIRRGEGNAKRAGDLLHLRDAVSGGLERLR